MSLGARIGEARYLIALLVLTIMLGGIMWFSHNDINLELRSIIVTKHGKMTIHWTGFFNSEPKVEEIHSPIFIDNGKELFEELRDTAIPT